MNQLVETVRSSVQTWECDQMGHMNVQFYLARENEGVASLASALGLRPRAQGEGRAGLLPREQHIRLIARYVGGGFGSKLGVSEEVVAAAIASV